MFLKIIFYVLYQKIAFNDNLLLFKTCYFQKQPHFKYNKLLFPKTKKMFFNNYS